MNIKDKIANDFAKKNGYTGATFEIKLNEFDVYTFNRAKGHFVGLPIYIFISDDLNVRKATQKEQFKILGLNPIN